MMSSWITVGVMALIVIGAVKLIGRMNKQRTVAGRSHAWLMVLMLAVPIAIGVLLLTVVYGRYDKKAAPRSSKYAAPNVSETVHDAMGKPAFRQVIVLDDGDIPDDLDKHCKAKQIIVVKGGKIFCLDKMLQVRRKMRVLQYRQDVMQHEHGMMPKRPRMDAPMGAVMKQALLDAKPAENNAQKRERSSIFNRYAEIISFLALVLGVLAKFYFDWYEARKTGAEAKFDPNQIIIAFILAVLVYLSVYSTLEK
ncbi:hypothetical protein LCGC14_2382910, partial [marine sediment metagenome]